jgi:hypothetical protein
MNMSFESPDFDCCERLRQAVMGLERSIANGAKMPEGMTVTTAMAPSVEEAAELAHLKQENEKLKATQAEATKRLDRLIDGLSSKMELDA